MVGDVNVFFNGRPPSAAASEDESDDEFAAELEIMIAGEKGLFSSDLSLL